MLLIFTFAFEDLNLYFSSNPVLNATFLNFLKKSLQTCTWVENFCFRLVFKRKTSFHFRKHIQLHEYLFASRVLFTAEDMNIQRVGITFHTLVDSTLHIEFHTLVDNTLQFQFHTLVDSTLRIQYTQAQYTRQQDLTIHQVRNNL